MTPLMFVAAAMILFVGMASAYRENKFISTIHQISASLAVVLYYLSIGIDFHRWDVVVYWIIGSLISYILFIGKKRQVYYIELLSFNGISLFLLFNTETWNTLNIFILGFRCIFNG